MRINLICCCADDRRASGPYVSSRDTQTRSLKFRKRHTKPNLANNTKEQWLPLSTRGHTNSLFFRYSSICLLAALHRDESVGDPSGPLLDKTTLDSVSPRSTRSQHGPLHCLKPNVLCGPCMLSMCSNLCFELVTNGQIWARLARKRHPPQEKVGATSYG